MSTTKEKSKTTDGLCLKCAAELWDEAARIYRNERTPENQQKAHDAMKQYELAKANVRFIAAAPELLSALTEARYLLAQVAGNLGAIDFTTMNRVRASAKSARLAIAKATSHDFSLTHH